MVVQEQSLLTPPHEPFNSLLLKITPIAMINNAAEIIRKVNKIVITLTLKFKLFSHCKLDA